MAERFSHDETQTVFVRMPDPDGPEESYVFMVHNEPQDTTEILGYDRFPDRILVIRGASEELVSRIRAVFKGMACYVAPQKRDRAAMSAYAHRLLQSVLSAKKMK